MTDLTAFFAARDGRKPRRYREYSICEVSEETLPSSAYDFKAIEQTKDTVKGSGTFSTGTAKLLRKELLKQEAILDSLKIKTLRLDSSVSEDDGDDWTFLSSRPRAGLPNKTDAPYGENSLASPSLPDYKASSGRKTNKEDDGYSSNCSPSLTARGGSGAFKKPTLRGSGGIYVPPKRGLGEVCPAKEDCQEMTPRSKGSRSSLFCEKVDTSGYGAPASGRSSWAKNCSKVSGGGQGGFERPTNLKDCTEITVRYTNSRSTSMNKKVDFREKSGSGALTSGGGTKSSAGSSGLTERLNATTSWAVSHPRNADIDSNDCSSSLATRGGSGTVNRPILRGSGGIYKPPMRGIGEVCPPKEDCKEMTRRSKAGRSSQLGGKADTSSMSSSGAPASEVCSLARDCCGLSDQGPECSERPTGKIALGGFVPLSLRILNRPPPRDR